MKLFLELIKIEKTNKKTEGSLLIAHTLPHQADSKPVRDTLESNLATVYPAHVKAV